MQENNNLTTENPGDHTHEALMPRPEESYDDYLTRGCRYWNVIQYHPELIKEDHKESLGIEREKIKISEKKNLL